MKKVRSYPPRSGVQERTKCEVYSRIIGYIRPIDNWNAGKKSEWDQRVTYAKLGGK